MASVTSKSEIEAIRRHMAQIRRELHEDVQGVVVGAEAATDWHHYFRQYPWAALGLTFAIGYVIVPRKHKTIEAEPETLRPSSRKSRGAAPEKPVEKSARKAGLIGTLFGMVWPVVMRAGQSYASQFLENWITQQGVIGPQSGGPESRPEPPSPPRPGGPRGGSAASGPGMPGGPRRP